MMWIVFWFVVAALLGATAVVSFIVFHATAPTTSTPFIEAAKVAILCLGGSGVILSTFFTAVNAYYQRRSDVIKNTYDLLTKWDDPHLFNARKWTRKTKETEDDTSKNKLLADIEESEDLKNSVILVLNYFEHVRFSINNRRIDRELFKESLGGTLVGIANRFMPYAEKHGEVAEKHLNELIALLKSK